MTSVETMNLSDLYESMGFFESPFSITPDTGYFFAGSQHQAALAHLRYGLVSGGFTLLTGEVGLGKTLLCRQLLREAPPGIRTAYIFNPNMRFEELLRAIHYDLTGARPAETSHGSLFDRMNGSLLELAAQGQKAAVILDEAHCLAPEVLEGLRLLSNLELEKEKLIYLILVGQPELERTLATPRLRPLRQRISVRFRLSPFTLQETMGYINYRVGRARMSGSFDFTAPAKMYIHRACQGAPRRINQVCERALMAAFAAGRRKVRARDAWLAAREIMGGLGG